LRYRRHPALLIREWGGEFAIFHEITGETHAIGGVAARVFSLLKDHASRDHLISRQNVGSPTEIDGAIAQLIDLELVESFRFA
jgi:hypothetical protein